MNKHRLRRFDALVPFVETIRGIKQRRFSNAYLNEGFSASVSALALISLWPSAGSFDQKGTSPHWQASALRPFVSHVL
jgi:hypothetical protein